MATRNQILARPVTPQHESPLFGILPAEIRQQIFAYTLTDFPDPSPDKHYDASTCYTRPSYFAPRKSDVRLLRTCRAVYRECWHMPFALREQTHWCTHENRAPLEYNTSLAIRNFATTLRKMVVNNNNEEVVIDRLRVFAQMWKLENGSLARLIGVPHLHPRILTLTIRHADWWHWEHDHPLVFDARWIEEFSRRLSPSTREFRIELESLERKKDQVKAIADQMCSSWFYAKKADDSVLYADADAVEESRWSGTSTWHGSRWVRDESEPGRINYYVRTVVFRPERVIERYGGSISQKAKENAQTLCNYNKLKCYGKGRMEEDESE